MALKFALWLAFLGLLTACVSSLQIEGAKKVLGSRDFDENFEIMWADDHVKTSSNGTVWHLVLDRDSGSGFKSKHKYRFGWFSMKLKLVPGDSAGVVTAYYMASDDSATRDELDFEFLGNRSGQPYAVQTNIFKGGSGEREKRHLLWFDPTEDFHTYSILWNSRQIVFFVDQVPLRVQRKAHKMTEHMYPEDRPMHMLSSIWNADDWATRGGLEKTDWTAAPFVSSYKKFHAVSCRLNGCGVSASSKWWDAPVSWTLTPKQRRSHYWVNKRFLIYDYCLDSSRYPTKPTECYFQK
eukprot:TRINITY_DN4403_c0_g1_i2.p1 TRINITY_DN4403_c0_g1~~TRINITY_DN4403_c0_g1_i2.p1  ORF type:complete len:319 (+),score=40.57 TRINITY_DN4403_c0_g1_i2:74-958(+)